MSWRDYPYYASWSAEDEEWVGTCPVYPSLSWLEPRPTDALDGIKALVREVEIDVMVGRWHDGEGDGTLAEFLGMTPEEYKSWVETGTALPRKDKE